ncbi:hypothetical protein BDP27DRAFT_1173298, partial [Rhodocollybia butyracea]
TPVVCQCANGHYYHVIYDLAVFIGDYPEQVYLAGIVNGWCGRYVLFQQLQMCCLAYSPYLVPFTEGFPRTNIHKMLSLDLLHQIIKGCFKDMLVDWTLDYLTIKHGETRANEIMDDID